jgi:hypothetical protein
LGESKVNAVKRIAVLVGLLVWTTQAVAQSWDIMSEPISHEEMVEILIIGERTELNSLGPASKRDKQLLINMYGVPREGPCIPETHYVCSFVYYLAVSEFGKYPPQGAFRIGEFGEIRTVEWFPRESTDPYGTARLRLEIANYPGFAFGYNADLEEERRILEIMVTTEGATQSGDVRVGCITRDCT